MVLINSVQAGGALGGTVEETIVRVLDGVPADPGWKWFPDCNMVGISRQLCEEERDRALADLQAKWRRSMLRIVS